MSFETIQIVPQENVLLHCGLLWFKACGMWSLKTKLNACRLNKSTPGSSTLTTSSDNFSSQNITFVEPERLAVEVQNFMDTLNSKEEKNPTWKLFAAADVVCGIRAEYKNNEWFFSRCSLNVGYFSDQVSTTIRQSLPFQQLVQLLSEASGEVVSKPVIRG